MKEFIKSLIQKNIYINDFVFRKYDSKREYCIEKVSKSLSQEDTINDTKKLYHFLTKVKNNNTAFWSYDFNKTANRLYGIKKSIFCGIVDKSYNFPAIEHGLILGNTFFKDIKNTSRATCITFSDFRKCVIHKKYNIPVFCVGPYINYAQDYYNKEEFKNIKNKLGKNLLVFVSHSTDEGNIKYNSKLLIEYLDAYKSDFDTISICVFWWDLDSKLVKLLEKYKFKIVCAGYREDIKFLSRLKGIIDLSDEVIGDGVGTHIGYCLARNKKFSIIDSVSQYENDNIDAFYKEQITVIKNAFSKEKEDIGKQKQIYNYYWGGNYFRNKNEIKAIYEINKDILKISNGFTFLYSKAVNNLLEKYNKTDKLKFEILREATSYN